LFSNEIFNPPRIARERAKTPEIARNRVLSNPRTAASGRRQRREGAPLSAPPLAAPPGSLQIPENRRAAGERRCKFLHWLLAGAG
jgi:hypothetical protein